jgi:hypothetical protein
MGNKAVSQLALNRLKRKHADRTMTGSLGYLGLGVHDVSIDEVDLSGFGPQGFLDFTFRGADGSAHKQRVWILDKRNPENYNALFIALVNSLFQDYAVYEKIDELVADESIQEAVFATFKGMKLRITVEAKKGYELQQDNMNRYVVVDAHTNEQLIDIGFESISAARQAATARKLQRSFPIISRYEAMNDETLVSNRQHFDFAIEGIKEAKRTVGNPRRIFNPAAIRNTSS